jgi:hypothetical protein
VLFDLKGKRRYVVQVTYLMLALLMGGGLVLFGIGSDNVQGGLVDAFTGGGSGGGSADSLASERIEQAESRLQKNPRDSGALTAVVRGSYQLATAKTGAESTSFPPEARPDLQRASDAWQRYLALDPPRPDDSLAGLMLQVYGPSGLARADEAARAAEIVAEARPSAAAYLNLAQYATLAGQKRKARLAERRALELASSAAERKAIKAQLKALNRAAAARGGGGALSPGGGGAGAPAGR